MLRWLAVRTNPSSRVDTAREAAALRLFGLVCDLPPADATRAVEELAEGDPAVVAAVERLLAADRRAETPLDHEEGAAVGRELLLLDLARSMIDGRAAGALDDAPLPDRIGAYRVVGRLGAGGMGVVYEAEQRHPRRRVAIKVIHPGALSELTLESFHREAEVLAHLTDPAIPSVYEAGENDGVPFIAMELVRGRRLDRYVVDRPDAERLALLIDVVVGVHKAHEAGIVHADITPSNVLVTVDGVPKIIDFGLAISGPVRPRSPAGTRGYMAPEQRRPGHVPDRRTDVFALGVLVGELLAVPERGLSRDLACVVARATAADPAARYPDAAALADDLRRYRDHRPVAARPRTVVYRLTRLVQRHSRLSRAIAVVTAVTAVAVLLAVRAEDAARQAHEDRAAARLTAVDARMAALRAVGDEAGAETVFQTFAQLPENAGTRALFEAWMRRGERLDDAAADGSEAFALAFTTARDPAQRQRALERLAESFASHAGWRSLDLVLTKLGDYAASSPTIDRLTRVSAAWRRDFGALTPGADDATAVAAGWANAHPLGVRVQVSLDTRWRDEGAFYIVTPDGRSTWWSRASPPELLAEAPRPEGAVVDELFPRPVADAGAWVVGTDRDDRAVLWQWQPGSGVTGTLVPRFSATLGRLHAATGWPGASWDAPPTALLGTGGRSPRTLYSLAPDGADFTVTEVAAAVRSPASDVNDLRLADVDGDGEDELLVSLGPWRAYDVRVVELDADLRLRLRARARLGSSSALAPVTVGGERLIAVCKNDRYPNPAVLGPDTPRGAPLGVHLFALGPDGLEARRRLPFPPTVGGIHTTMRLLAGDLDGDGLEDLVAGVSAVTGDVLVAYVQRPGGRFDPVVVGDAAPELLLQLDDDPPLELLVRLGDTGDGWILGAGDQPPPPLATLDAEGGHEVSAELLAWEGDPALARIARGAGELVELGMLRTAAAELLRGAEVASESARRARLLTSAARLHELLGEPYRAAPLYDEALGDGPEGSSVAALTGAARAHLAEYDLASATARLEALRDAAVGEPSRHAAERLAALRPLVAELSPAVELIGTSRLPASASDDLEIVTPQALGRAPAGGLRVELLSDMDVVARVPLRYDGGILGVSLDATVERLEIGGGLEVVLRRRGADTPALALEINGRGGGLYVKRYAGCRLPVPDGGAMTGHEPSAPGAAGRLRVRFDRIPGQGEGTCRVWRGEAEWPLKREVVPSPDPPAGDYELVLRGEGRPIEDGLTVLRATLTSLELTGLEVVERPPSSLDEAHRSYLASSWRDALARYDAVAPGAPWGLMAALEVEPEADLRERLRALLAADGAPDRALLELLRLRPRRLSRVWFALDPEGFAEAFARAWGTSLRYTDDDAIARVLTDATLDELRVTAHASDAVARVVTTRAARLLGSGDAPRALAALASVLALAETEARAALLAEARLVAARASLASGDPATTRRHLARWRALETDPRPAADILADRAETAALIPHLP